jgi:hypothetical protein
MNNLIKISLICIFSLGIGSCDYFRDNYIADKKTQAADNCIKTCEAKFPCVKHSDGTQTCSVEQDKCKSGCLTTMGNP